MQSRKAPGFRDKLQLQHHFSGTPLSSLSELDLGVYEKIPDFRDRCPLCGGRNCAVRHGLYFRQVVDVDGGVYKRFAIPRFLCRRKGPQRSEHVTFSILPEALVARRHFSLPLMIWVLKLLFLGRQSVGQVLEALMALSQEGEEAFAVEEVSIYRILHLFSGVYVRLQSFPIPEVPLPAGLQQRRAQAGAVLESLRARASPQSVAVAFHKRYFPHLLFDLRLG